MSEQKVGIEYFAGFFDGEGCVSIRRLRFKRKNGLCISYQIQAQTTNTNIAVLNVFCERFGGRVDFKTVPKKEGVKPCFTWRVNCNKAMAFLNAIRPFLIVKCEDVDIVLNFDLMRRKKMIERNKTKLKYSDQTISDLDTERHKLISRRNKGLISVLSPYVFSNGRYNMKDAIL